MKYRIQLLLPFLLVLPGLVMAESGTASRYRDPVAAEMSAIVRDNADTVISDLTFGEVDELMKRLSVPIQEAAYVEKSKTASWMMPGKGQFMNEDVVSGILFMTADIVVAAGTLIGTYFLLPEELQFSNLDYLNAPYSEIKASWESAANAATLKDSLAHFGVFSGGMILRSIISGFSASHAGRLAQQRIDEGVVTFEPISAFAGHGGLGFGARMKY